MGIFDAFKTKVNTDTGPNKISLRDFSFYYLYGVATNPNKSSSDSSAFNDLYKKVIGDKGGIIISNSFHPYYMVNPKGTTPWIAAYVKFYTNEKKDEVFDAIVNQNAIYMVDTSSMFKDAYVWPDTRLTFENPIFEKYVPFVIPFLVYKNENKTNWDLEVNKKIDATKYVDSITEAIRFFMPEPAFILGLDEFDEKRPSLLIDNFMNCKLMLERI